MGNLDILKPVLGAELYTQFLEKMQDAKGISLINAADGSYVPKAKFDTEIAAKRQYLSQVEALGRDKAALDEEIEKLRGELDAARKEQKSREESLGAHAKQIEALKKEVEKLTGDLGQKARALEAAEKAQKEVERLTQEVGARNHDIETLKKRGQIESALRKAGAKNPEMLGRMIDPDMIRVEAGKVEGLEQQLTALKASDPYLFNESTAPRGGVEPGPVREGTDVNRQVNLEIRRAAGFNV